MIQYDNDCCFPPFLKELANDIKERETWSTTQGGFFFQVLKCFSWGFRELGSWKMTYRVRGSVVKKDNDSSAFLKAGNTRTPSPDCKQNRSHHICFLSQGLRLLFRPTSLTPQSCTRKILSQEDVLWKLCKGFRSQLSAYILISVTDPSHMDFLSWGCDGSHTYTMILLSSPAQCYC